jgi:CHASE2 domain-containing sensor protein
MDGVETHAHMLDGLLQNKMLVGLDEGIMLFLVIVLVLVSVFVYFYVPKYLSPICAIAIILLLLWISRILYDNERILLDISLLLLAGGIITYPVTYIYRFFVIDREKRELQDNFGHYIDPHVVEEIASR